MHANRLPSDLGHIVRGIIAGTEPRDAIEQIICEARGEKAPAAEADTGGTVKALLQLATQLGAPAGTRKLLSDLDQRITAAKSAAKAAVDEQTKLKLAQATLEDVRAKHERDMTARSAAVEAAARKREADAAATEKAAKDLLAKAQSEAADAAKTKARLAEKLRLIEAA